MNVNEKPMVGDVRWSDCFNCEIVLNGYISDDWWYFVKANDPRKIPFRAKSKWSDMKIKK